MKFSIVVPVKAINDYIRESMQHILELDFLDFEVLIITDYPEDVSFPKTRVIPSGPVGPSYKRDMAIEHAQGEILAFLDDDAFPRKDWLTRALSQMQGHHVAAVCGPAVTPYSDPFWAKLSGAFYTSYIGSGTERFRYWPGKRVKEVDDYPSVNFLVRKSVFEEVGGFDTHYWPGEDTKLCLDIINRGYKIIYDPEIFVWHHRRNSLKKHMLQIFKYSVHRGFFAKKYPQTSLRPIYLIPSLFVLYCFSIPILAFLIELRSWKCYSAPLWLYLGLVVISSMFEAVKLRNLGIFFTLPVLSLISHLTYGVGFLMGLFKKELVQ